MGAGSLSTVTPVVWRWHSSGTCDGRCPFPSASVLPVCRHLRLCQADISVCVLADLAGFAQQPLWFFEAKPGCELQVASSRPILATDAAGRSVAAEASRDAADAAGMCCCLLSVTFCNSLRHAHVARIVNHRPPEPPARGCVGWGSSSARRTAPMPLHRVSHTTLPGHLLTHTHPTP